MGTEITLYALSTCMWCKKTKTLLDEKGVDYRLIYVNELDGDERKETIDEMMEYNPNRSFPTIIIGDEVVIGFKPHEIEAALAKAGI